MREAFGSSFGTICFVFYRALGTLFLLWNAGLVYYFLVAETTSQNPGFGWSNEKALWLYGWYTMLVYIAAIPGGWIADNLLGQKKMVMLGGLLLCMGHGILAFDSELSFYIGCVFIILGVGGLKPNISSMVGGLYPPGDERRDLGFYIFYMGINLGAFLAPLFCGWVGETYNWHYGLVSQPSVWPSDKSLIILVKNILLVLGELKKISVEKKRITSKKIIPGGKG